MSLKSIQTKNIELSLGYIHKAQDRLEMALSFADDWALKSIGTKYHETAQLLSKQLHHASDILCEASVITNKSINIVK
jgi:hypothetical protein